MSANGDILDDIERRQLARRIKRGDELTIAEMRQAMQDLDIALVMLGRNTCIPSRIPARPPQ